MFLFQGVKEGFTSLFKKLSICSVPIMTVGIWDTSVSKLTKTPHLSHQTDGQAKTGMKWQI